jgi:hypothetical protein
LILIIIFAKINKNNMIPSGTRFIGFSDSVNLTEKRSASVNAETAVYTVDELRGYKVYTALLTQSGKSDNGSLFEGDLTVGVTYIIMDDGDGKDCDFTNVGAPNNNFGTYFVATGTDPNSWGVNTYLEYNVGAPVVTVLENTIGNIWWTQQDRGSYWANSYSLFTRDKTLAFISQSIASGMEKPVGAYTYGFSKISVEIETYDSANAQSDGVLSNTPIEIRVYN